MGRKYVSRLNGGPQEKTVVIVLETLPYDDNIRPKKLRSLLIIFSENWFSEQKSEADIKLNLFSKKVDFFLKVDIQILQSFS